MEKPTILGIVSYQIFPARMGGQHCAAGFYRELAREAKVVLAVSKSNDAKAIEGIGIHAFLFDHWLAPLNLLYLFRLVTLIKRHQVSVIIIEHSYFGWLGWLLRLITGKPFIIRSHNIEGLRFKDLQRPLWRQYLVYEKRMHQKANHNFFITAEDHTYALEQWKLVPEKCSIITYGTNETATINYARSTYRRQLLEKYQLPYTTSLFLFNGSLNYPPNTDALQVIVHEILPLLRQAKYGFRLFVCGLHLSPQWEQVLAEQAEIIYLGFVPDIDYYFRATDCSINPVTLGGGIKTKLVEALAHHQMVVTTATGAKGIPKLITGDRMLVVPDYHWMAFAAAMRQVDIYDPSTTPPSFFSHFGWQQIIHKALVSLKSV